MDENQWTAWDAGCAEILDFLVHQKFPDRVTTLLRSNFRKKAKRFSVKMGECVNEDGSVRIEEYLYKKTKTNGEVPVIRTPDEASEIFKQAHETARGHIGVKGTYKNIARRAYWRGIAEDISRRVENCETCKKTRQSLQQSQPEEWDRCPMLSNGHPAPLPPPEGEKLKAVKRKSRPVKRKAVEDGMEDHKPKELRRENTGPCDSTDPTLPTTATTTTSIATTTPAITADELTERISARVIAHISPILEEIRATLALLRPASSQPLSASLSTAPASMGPVYSSAVSALGSAQTRLDHPYNTLPRQNFRWANPQQWNAQARTFPAS